MTSNSYWFSAMGTLISASKENLHFCINDALPLQSKTRHGDATLVPLRYCDHCDTLLQGATAVEDKTQGCDAGATQIL